MAAATPNALLTLLRGGGRTTAAARAAWHALLPPDALAVDATAGRGDDTVTLARIVGPAGRVIAMDASEAAVAATRSTVAAAAAAASRPLAPVDVVCACHSTLANVLAVAAPLHRPRAVVFNLGWLPGAPGRAATATRPDTTLAALDAAAAALERGGFISVCSYVGHAGGAEEAAAVRGALARLDPNDWIVVEANVVNRAAAPLLTLAWRKE